MNRTTKLIALAGIMSALMIVLFTLETVIGADNAAGGTFAVGAIRILLFLRLEIRTFKRRGIRLVVARNRVYRGEPFVYNSHNIGVAESYHGDSGLRNISPCENVVR